MKKRAAIIVVLSVAAVFGWRLIRERTPRVPPPKRVVLVVVDALRADHVSAYGYPRPTTPEIDNIAAQAVMFKRAVATASWTQPSMASVFTSTYPTVHGIRMPPMVDGPVEMSVLPPALPTMAEFLREQGLTTHAVSSQPWCNELSGFDRGFDDFNSTGRLLDPNEAGVVMDAAIDWLAGRAADDRFFLYVHMMGPHYPYLPPPPYKGKFTTELVFALEGVFADKDYLTQIAWLNREGNRFFAGRPDLLAELVGRYDEEVLFSDAQVGRVWRALETRGMLEETVFIVIADHGEEFMEHGGFTHGQSLHREQLMVPLILYYPPLGKGVTLDGVVSLVDLFPTLADLFGKRLPKPAQGKSLLDVVFKGEDHAPALSELLRFGLIKLTDSDHSLIYKAKGAGRPESWTLFNTGRDPYEQQDVSRENPQIADDMLSELLELEHRNSRVEIPRSAGRQLSDEQVQRLQDIGYLH